MQIPFYIYSNNQYFTILRIDVKTTFAEYIKPGTLYLVAAIFGILTIYTVLATYYTLYRKKKKFLVNKLIRQRLEQWIAEVVVNPTDSAVVIPAEFKNPFKAPLIRQLLIDELVRNKNNFLGEASGNVIKIYNKVGLSKDSLQKLSSNESHIQCKGIHEICAMDQKNFLRRIYRLTNSPYKDVRVESQIAIVQWFGFIGLRFLEVVSYPITPFHQLKLLEELRPQKFTGLPKLTTWLRSNNDTIVDLALKLAEHYNQRQVHYETVDCLNHRSEAVRIQAVKTLAKIAIPSTAGILITSYPTQSLKNRLNILNQLGKINRDENSSFLQNVLLFEKSESLKVAAARALAKSETQGIKILERIANEKEEPYRSIVAHVKMEVKK